MVSDMLSHILFAFFLSEFVLQENWTSDLPLCRAFTLVGLSMMKLTCYWLLKHIRGLHWAILRYISIVLSESALKVVDNL